MTTEEGPDDAEKELLAQLIEETNFHEGAEGEVTGRLDIGIDHLKGLGILNVYRDWIGKSDPVDNGRGEGIHVSCPIPGHLDRNPSAWANTDRNLWVCGGCHLGGDVIDLFAIAQGQNFPDYKRDSRTFVKVVEQACRDTGLDPDFARIQHSSESRGTGQLRESPFEDTNETEGGTISPEEQLVFPGMEDFAAPSLDWREVLGLAGGERTFLWQYMAATEITEIPNEFLLWSAMQAVGLAVGRSCHINGNVYPNLILALLGRTGQGKSRSVALVRELIRTALPFDRHDPGCEGVKILARPGSGEALIETLNWEPTGRPQGMRAWLDFDEMKALMDTAARNGSTLRENITTAVDSPPYMTTHTRTLGTVEAAEVFLAIITGGQPDAMQSILSRNDSASGFANRFLYISGTQKPMQGWLEIETPDMHGLDVKLRTLRRWALDHQASADQGAIMVADIAVGRLDEIRAWMREMRERPDGDMYARLELHMIKVLIILSVNAKTDIADPDIVEAAYKLIESTIVATEEVSENVNHTLNEFYRKKIVDCIEVAEANGDLPPSAGDIYRKLRQGRRDKVQVARALNELTNINLIQEVHIPGKRVTRYHLRDQSRWWEQESMSA